MTRRWLGICAVVTIAGSLLAGCGDKATPQKPNGPRHAPAPTVLFEGLPLSGDLAAAKAAGFTHCLDATKGVRCRKEGVTFMGVGPLSAAVDLDATDQDGLARFDQVTLWYENDQGKVLDIGTAMKNSDWQSCLTPDAERYLKPPSPVRIAIDTNYWGTRRVVISAPAPSPKAYCG